MQNTISNLSISSNKNYFLNGPKPAAPEVKENKNPKDSGHNTTALLASLSGLAVLCMGIWGVKKTGKNNALSGQSSQSVQMISESIDVTTEKISKLKKLILADYVSKRNNLIHQMNKFDEFDYKIPFKNGPDLRSKIEKLEKEYSEISANSTDLISKNKKIIREKLNKLMPDKQWQELKKLRKQLIKTEMNDKSVDQRKIAHEKIIIVNDLLINKVYPESRANYNLYGLTDEQALTLVNKKYKTYDEFTSYYDSVKNMAIPFEYEEIGSRFSHNGALSMRDIFPEEVNAIDYSKKLLEETEKKLEATKVLYNKYCSELKQLAMEYKETDGVKELKEMIKHLENLRTSLQNAA